MAKTTLLRRIAAVALVSLSCATAPRQPEASHPRAKRLVIIGINDTHGALLEQPRPAWLKSFTDAPIGGAAWFGGWVDAVRKDAQEHGGAVMILDAGDLFQGTLVSNQFKGKSVIDVYQAVGVTAAAIGNHEFDFGVPVLAERIAEARFPILAANIFKKGTRERPSWARPTALVEVGGVKVGIIGLATVETATVTNPAFVTELEFAPGGPIAAPLADELRAQGATVVVVVAHAGPLTNGGGRPAVPADEEAQQIALACAGKIDALVSGHHHTSIGCCKAGEARCRCGTGPLTVLGVPIVQSGAKLTGLSLIELDLDEAGRRTGAQVNQGTTPNSGAPQILFHLYNGAQPSFRGHPVSADAKVAAIVQGYDLQVRQLRDQRIGSTEVALVKGGDADLLANFAADALRSGAGGGLKAQFALQNRGGLRIPEIAAGPITFGQIFDLTPFDNQQVVVTLSAAQLRDALESVIKAGKGPLKPSGLRYTIDWSMRSAATTLTGLPAGALITEMDDAESGKPLCKTDSCTKTSCSATCAPGDYTVALTDFLANGGDGLALPASAPRQVGPVLSRDIMVAFVKQHDPITAALLGSAGDAKPRISQAGARPADHD